MSHKPRVSSLGGGYWQVLRGNGVQVFLSWNAAVENALSASKWLYRAWGIENSYHIIKARINAGDYD